MRITEKVVCRLGGGGIMVWGDITVGLTGCLVTVIGTLTAPNDQEMLEYSSIPKIPINGRKRENLSFTKTICVAIL